MQFTDLKLPDDPEVKAQWRAIDAVSQLNKLLNADRVLVETMVNNRVPVSSGYIALDEFVYMDDEDGAPPNAGLIGVLNGILLLDKHRVAAHYDDDMVLTHFSVVEIK